MNLPKPNMLLKLSILGELNGEPQSRGGIL